MSVPEQILDLARWAPSGDNTQIWRFQILGERHIVVHGFDTRMHCVYDIDGHPSQISIGALLENITIAASEHGLAASVTRRLDSPEESPVFDVTFHPELDLTPDPLIPYVRTRSVQRRPLSTRALTLDEKLALEKAVGESHHVLWLEGGGNRWRVAKLLFDNAKIRLTMPEAYLVHRDVIAWRARYSDDKVPDQAIGTDPLTTRLMQWVMGSWGRVEFFNTFLAGTWIPRLQLDLIPGLACAGHFLLLAEKAPQNIDNYVSAGRAFQRFWLTATQLGLQLQPEMTPLIFAAYVRADRRFTEKTGLWEKAQLLAERLRILTGGNNLERVVFMGRVGAGPSSTARSLRLPIQQLMTTSALSKD